MDNNLHVVTGGLGYSGKYIVARLLKEGHAVRTITNSPGRSNPFGKDLDIKPMDFNRPDSLAESLRGASTLYNTYWVRFNHETFSHQEAVDNTKTLFENLVVQLLQSDFPKPDGTRLILIDAIDEATCSGRNEIAELIRDHWADTPIQRTEENHDLNAEVVKKRIEAGLQVPPE